QRDRKQLALADAAALAAHAAAKAELAAAEASARTEFAALAEEAATLADEAALAAPRAAYAAVLLAEKERARAAGLIDDAELAAARWERDRLAYENDLARCDRAVLAAKIAAQFPRSIAP
ncbi:MAG: hypothetical protein JNG85_00965, partial [Spirochaetaceae bacterium]|nr:hypothetical protein [Spirochaetaceae bacterium]